MSSAGCVEGALPPGPDLSCGAAVHRSRLRRDFTVTDAARLLTAARTAYALANPGASPQDAAAAVTSAADAMFTILESEGILGRAVDHALAARLGDGLQAARIRRGRRSRLSRARGDAPG